MKRVIKFWSDYKEDSNSGKFSDCSTKYEVLPALVPDDASNLKDFAKELKLKTIGNVKIGDVEKGFRRHGTVITHFIKLDETKHVKNKWKDETHQVYLGFITVPTISIPIKLKPNSRVTKEEARILVEERSAGIDDVGDIDGTTFVIMEGWQYYHLLPLNGYSLESFQRAVGAKDRTFYDEVERCSGCDEFDWRDNGYTYNHRGTDDGNYGINCGCFQDYAKRNIDQYANESKEAIELDIAEELQKEGRLEFVERFIGGMTDGRGGYFRGEPTREGDPTEVLEELLKENPNGKYIFSHDESGQFQTYFSVWKLKAIKRKKAA